MFPQSPISGQYTARYHRRRKFSNVDCLITKSKPNLSISTLYAQTSVESCALTKQIESHDPKQRQSPSIHKLQAKPRLHSISDKDPKPKSVNMARSTNFRIEIQDILEERLKEWKADTAKQKSKNVIGQIKKEVIKRKLTKRR